MMEWIKIGKLDDIPQRGARCVTTPYGKIAIFRTFDDKVFALADSCPHKGGPLSQGIVLDRSVSCPLHNQVFSLETGQAQGADEASVKNYSLENREGILYITAKVLQKEVA